ncbi:hypothetical protein D8L93_10455 [Sodalis-like symbiont of Bactericera trigonica]|nr:hypothetical protein D8L93_10455 [Sodalis-like symbiont of Bactericera trigonica]
MIGSIDEINEKIHITAKELHEYTDDKSLTSLHKSNNYTDSKIIQANNHVENEFKRVDVDLIENTKSITKLTNNLNEGAIGLVRQSKTDGSITVAAETKGKSVSVNGKQGPRLIRDVNAGVNSNDAVNVSQLNTLLSKNQISVDPISSKEQAKDDKKDGIAFGGGAESKAEGAISIGTESQAAGERSIALGKQANSRGSNSLALGAGASAPGKSAVALGNNSVADRDNSVSVGSPGHE